MLSHYHVALGEADSRRYGRFVDTDISQDLREEPARCLSRYDGEEAHAALDALFDLFNRLVRSVYDAAGYPVPETQRAEIARLLATLDTADRSGG